MDAPVPQPGHSRIEDRQRVPVHSQGRQPIGDYEHDVVLGRIFADSSTMQ
jgi:hypothetical protein